ncbi:hypothetical protein [Nocardia sp. NPDC046763]|uniref:hypothetical protein n=1 Tax=Nocardia sp. NPDC046763 TaxID=3155256 RepID=UPI0033EE351F
MATGYSRMIAAVMIPTRQSADLLAGHWELISAWGRVRRVLVWDNESAIGQWRGGKPQLTDGMNCFRGTLGIKVVQCRTGDPEAKQPAVQGPVLPLGHPVDHFVGPVVVSGRRTMATVSVSANSPAITSEFMCHSLFRSYTVVYTVPVELTLVRMDNDANRLQIIAG